MFQYEACTRPAQQSACMAVVKALVVLKAQDPRYGTCRESQDERRPYNDPPGRCGRVSLPSSNNHWHGFSGRSMLRPYRGARKRWYSTEELSGCVNGGRGPAPPFISV